MNTKCRKLTITKLELRFRDLLISFSIAVYFGGFIDELIMKSATFLGTLSFYIFFLIVAISPLATRFRKEVAIIFDNLEDDDEDTNETYNVLYRYLGIVAIYYLAQLGLCTIYLPNFIDYRFLGTPFYAIVFLFNCYCISWVYSRTVFK